MAHKTAKITLGGLWTEMLTISGNTPSKLGGVLQLIEVVATAMKIEGSGSLRPGQTRKTDRSGNGSDFRAHLKEGDEGGQRISGPMAAMGINPLIALQEVDDALTGRRKAVRRAEDILDKLEELRVGLLLGTFPREKLHDLVRMVQSRRDSVTDPRLQEVLEEIDLRAQVEIAKLAQGE